MHKTYLMIHIWEFVWSASVYMSIAWRQKYPWSLLRISSDHLIMSRRCFSLYSPDVSRASKSKPFSSAYRFFIGPERRKILDPDTFFASHSVKWSFPDFRLPENRSTHAGLLLADVWDIVISSFSSIFLFQDFSHMSFTESVKVKKYRRFHQRQHNIISCEFFFSPVA